MCLAIPGKILNIKDNGQTAAVDFNGIQKDINIALVQNTSPAPGDYLIVHAGFAIQKLAEQDALDILKIIEKTPKHAHENGKICNH